MSIKTDIAALREAGLIVTQKPGTPFPTFELDPEAKADYLEGALRRAIERKNRSIQAMETWKPNPIQPLPPKLP